jgi:Exoribonuclease Xrn1 D1 domain
MQSGSSSTIHQSRLCWGLQVTKDGSKAHTKEEELEWLRNADKLKRDFLVKKGVELGPLLLLFHVRPCQGLVRCTDGTIEKRFAKELIIHPLQVILAAPCGCCCLESRSHTVYSSFCQFLFVGYG